MGTLKTVEIKQKPNKTYLRVAYGKVAKILDEDRTALHTSLVAAVEGIEEYMEVKDESSHRYEIPRSKKKEWEEFCEIPEDDERSWDVPEWANRIDGMPVRSIKEQVLTIINSIFKE